MTDALEDMIASSSRRLVFYLTNPDAPPRQVVDHEFKLLVKRIGSLVGPERVRRWMDELSDLAAQELATPDYRTLT